MIEGIIKSISKTKTFGANGFRKRELIVTTNEQYPQNILIEFVQDKCDTLENYKVGQGVKVSINVKGREWINPQGEAKYFNSLQGWKIQATDRPGSAVNKHEEPSPEQLAAARQKEDDDFFKNLPPKNPHK